MILHGDCLEHLKQMKAHSVEALVTDPPAGISFMNKQWDSNKGGSKEWITWMSEVMRECYRVLKPGAHGLVWAIPRTSHWTATACEEAGFEIRDVITHLFGSGFPKSLDISKAIDKAAGAEREVVGYNPKWNSKPRAMAPGEAERNAVPAYTAPSKEWQGFGTALKPASEHWILVRKPLSEKTVAANVLKYGTGGINIDGCRIGFSGNETDCRIGTDFVSRGGDAANDNQVPNKHYVQMYKSKGRFPANLVLSHNPDCVQISKGKRAEGKRAEGKRAEGKRITTDFSIAGGKERERDCQLTYGEEIPEQWACTTGCAVAMLDEQSGVSKSTGGGMKDFNKSKLFQGDSAKNRTDSCGFGDSGGGASRFFYCAKASKRERGQGNNHPTVKSTKLMSYLIRLITPPGGLVLDPFMGSGSTGVAATQNGFQFIGIENEKEYVAIAEKRIEAVSL